MQNLFVCKHFTPLRVRCQRGGPGDDSQQAAKGIGSVDVYAMGATRGVLLHWDGSAWKTIGSPAANTMTGLWHSENALFVVGESGNILTYGE